VPILTNQFVLPEMIAHAFLTLCFLLSGQWLAFLLNAPLVGYNVNKWVPVSRIHHLINHSLSSAIPSPLPNSFRPLAADKQDHVQEPHVRCDRNLPYTIWSQEGIFHQARFLPRFILLLPLPVSPCLLVYTGGKLTIQYDPGFDLRFVVDA